MACNKCDDLDLEYRIRSPGDLRKAFAVARDNIADGTIREIHGGTFMVDAKTVADGEAWPGDHLSYRFRCNKCGAVFHLDAETYHGYGGQWAPADQTPEAKLERRIIGELPPSPREWPSRHDVLEWIKQNQVMFVLLICSVCYFAWMFMQIYRLL